MTDYYDDYDKPEAGEHCEVCGKFVRDFEYERCCDGLHCDCKGEVLEPCLCSEDCADEYDEMIERWAQ